MSFPFRKEQRGTCPACGYADSYAETVKNGRRIGWCASCQDKRAIAAILRGADTPAPHQARDSAAARQKAADESEKRLEAARIIWKGAAPVTAECHAGKYLARRALHHLIGNPSLRYREDCPHPAGGRYHAMIAAVLDGVGKITAVHRTYLASDGSKARVEPVKASKGMVMGGAIHLATAGQEIVIGEGIETSASAGLLLGLPAWAAVSAGNLATGVTLPPHVQSVVIAADDDGVNAQGRNPGIEAAEAAFRRFTAQGRKVRIFKPTETGQDFNDVLLNRVGRMA